MDSKLIVPEVFRKFLSLNHDVKLSKNEVIKQIFLYISDKNLRDKQNNTFIIPDKTLMKLFTLVDGQRLSNDSLRRRILFHYDKNIYEDHYSHTDDLFSELEYLNNKKSEIEKNIEKIKQNDTEFNKQREYLINKFREFIEIEISNAEVAACLFNPISFDYVGYYFKDDENLLLKRKVYNRYARYHEIRYEDSVDIIYDFIQKIKPIKDKSSFEEEQYKNKINYQSKSKEYVPLFY